MYLVDYLEYLVGYLEYLAHYFEYLADYLPVSSLNRWLCTVLKIPKRLEYLSDLLLDYLPDLLVAIKCFKYLKRKIKGSTRLNTRHV